MVDLSLDAHVRGLETEAATSPRAFYGLKDVVAADGHIYFRYADGTMTLVKASADAFSEVGSFKVPGSGDRPSWSHPVILDGRLYLREGDKLLCYELKG